MALSEKEKDWLERRKNICARCSTSYRGRPYFCGRWRYGKCIDFDPKSCIDENVDFEDAAEFEARVAVKLATVICSGCEDFNEKNVCPLAIYQTTGIYECRMKHARLAVEAEMEEKQ